MRRGESGTPVEFWKVYDTKVQKAYYTEKITKNPEWKMAGIYADEGITGTSMKKRDDWIDQRGGCVPTNSSKQSPPS